MDKNGFLEAVNSLKLYRRAELVDEKGRALIQDLYVDPLPNDHVLRTVLHNNSTFLVGRKGTGKSTIFQRAQSELDKNKNITWAYIDIKSLYESSTSEIVGSGNIGSVVALDPKIMLRIHVFRAFMIELVNEIKKQIENRIKSSTWATFKNALTESSAEVFETLDEFLVHLNKDEYLNVTGAYVKNAQSEQSTKEAVNSSIGSKVELSSSPNLSFDSLLSLIHESQQKSSSNYAHVFIRLFRIKELIQQLKQIVASLNLKKIYLFIDDFSELPKNEMEELVDTILGPFNNWSDEFIKLKVAVYPGRLYLGQIDRSKIDEVYLDIYRAYGVGDLNSMEALSLSFTKRLIDKRIDRFCKGKLDEYFALTGSTGAEEIYNTLFHVSLGNPRILGYILYFCYESSIIHDQKIALSNIKDASKRYFNEKIGAYFKLNRFLHESFEERSSIYSLKELYEAIVKKAKELRSYRESKVMQQLPGRPPTSHFYINQEFDSVLASLELNFFLTKYYEMRDRDGHDVSVYAINYGLCQQESINFGRPTEKREHRLYYIERIFDNTHLIQSYLKMNQEIVCTGCGAKHDTESLAAIKQFDMLCPACRKANCKIVNLSKKYEELIRNVAQDSLLPQTELDILKALHDERTEMFANQIAMELDCSYQLVGKRGKMLADRNLVERDTNDAGRRVFKISPTADETYFKPDTDEFDF